MPGLTEAIAPTTQPDRASAPAPGWPLPGLPQARLGPWLALPAGGAVLGALLGYAGPGALADAIQGADARFIALAVLAYALFFAVRGLRWAFLLRSAGAPGGPLLPAALESVAWMVSTFLPFKAGDAVRAVALARRRAVPLAAVAGTVAIERALDLAGLALAASAGLAFLAASDVAIPDGWGPVLALAWLLPLLGLAGALAAARLLRARPRGNAVQRLLGQLLDGVLAIVRQPRLAGPAAAWTALVKACQVLVYVALIHAFVPGAPAAVAAAVPLFLLSFLVTFTPGHVGTYEAAFVLVFGLVGLPAAGLAAAAVAVHASAIAIVTALGILSLALVWATGRAARLPVPALVPGAPPLPRPRDEEAAA